MNVLIDGVQYVPVDSGDDAPEDNEVPNEAPPPADALSPHFRRAEFTCNHCGALPANMPPKELVDILEQVRTHFNAPTTVNSGYRCPTHNANVGGAKNSRHLIGDAADIAVRGVPASQVHAFLTGVLAGKGGLGRYNSFTHVDVRPNPARW